MLELFSVGTDCATTLTSSAAGMSLMGVCEEASSSSLNKFKVLALVIWRSMAKGSGSDWL